MSRYNIAISRRFYAYRIKETELIPFVELHLFNKSKWIKLDKLDRLISCKIGHWYEFYANKIVNLESMNEFEQLASNFGLIANFSAIEATIGNPPYSNKQFHKRLTEFFTNNLSENSINSLLKGFNNNLSIEEIIKQLILKRNAFLHKADLIRMPSGNVDFAGMTTLDSKGRKSKMVLCSFTPSCLTQITKEAICNYMLKSKSTRIPKQDLRLYKRKTKNNKK